MRIAIVSDIHHRPGGSPEVLEALRAFVEQSNSLGVDLLLDLGDRLRDTTPEGDRLALGELATIFSRFDGPRFHLMGNHDVINLTASDHANILDVEIGTRIFAKGPISLIAWQPDVHFKEPYGFSPAKPYLPELLSALHQAPGNTTILASHYPISGQTMVGNPHFEVRPDWAFPPDAAEIRAALIREEKCRLFISGHIHQTTLHVIDGLAHVAISAVSEPVGGTPGLTTAICNVGEKIIFDISGVEPSKLTVPQPQYENGLRMSASATFCTRAD